MYHGYSSTSINDTTAFGSLVMIVFAQQYLSLTLYGLAQLILYVFVFPSICVQNSGYSPKIILQNSLFWGFFISSFVGLFVIIIYNCTIIDEMNNISFSLFALPFPVPFSLVLFFIVCIFAGILCKRGFKQFLHKRFCIAMTIIPLFVFVLSYHSGWIMLLLITYPLQVGTVILILIASYITLAFSCAFVVHCFRKRNNWELSINLLFISCCFFMTLLYFLITYYQILAKYPHEDSITKFLPTLLPVVFIGFCTWIAKNIIFKVIDYNKKNQVSHINENRQNSSNESSHESRIENRNEDNENTPLLSGYQSTSAKRTNLSINSNAWPCEENYQLFLIFIVIL